MNLCFLLQGIVNPFGRGTRWFNMTNHIYPTPPGTRLMSDSCMENITFHTRKRQSSCNRSQVLSSFMTYYGFINQSNTTDATSVTRTAYPSGTPEFTPILVSFVFLDVQFSVLCFVDRCLSFFVWPFHCLSFALRILITSLVSSNSSFSSNKSLL